MSGKGKRKTSATFRNQQLIDEMEEYIHHAPGADPDEAIDEREYASKHQNDAVAADPNVSIYDWCRQRIADQEAEIVTLEREIEAKLSSLLEIRYSQDHLVAHCKAQEKADGETLNRIRALFDQNGWEVRS